MTRLKGMAASLERQHDHDRMIVFIENISSCENVLKWFEANDPSQPVTIYNADLTDQAAAANANYWRETPKCIMIATSGFGAGINYAHVLHMRG